MTTDHHSISHPVTTPSNHTYWAHPLAAIFNHTFIFLSPNCKCKRNVRLKIVASGCDQSVCPVGVVAGCGHWVGLNDDQWSCVFKTSLPCFHSSFQLHHDQLSTLHRISFFQKKIFVRYMCLHCSSRPAMQQCT